MATVFAQMGGDAIGARRLGQNRGAQGFGPDAAAGVADGGHVVDVDAQPERALRFHIAPVLLVPSRGGRLGWTGGVVIPRGGGAVAAVFKLGRSICQRFAQFVTAFAAFL